MLDDIGRAMYKKLQKDADGLSRVRAVIKCKKKEAKLLTEEWLYLEGQELDDDADQAYNRKCRLDDEIQGLESQERLLLQRIQTYVASQA